MCVLDVEREYKVLTNKLNRYKKRKLGFECGVVTGYVTEINLVEDPDAKFPWDKAIEVKGFAGFDENEKVLMLITEKWVKGKDYKYWSEYHILEWFPRRYYD